jgi:hypothetical protein
VRDGRGCFDTLIGSVDGYVNDGELTDVSQVETSFNDKLGRLESFDTDAE